jgi:tetratricopeptide (TPR) repeat protein
MNKKSLSTMLVFIFLCFMTLQSSACTMVMASKNGVVFAGNNEDWKNPRTIANFFPASADEFGRVCFGFDDGYAQGGMNDQGLFIDGNAISPIDYIPSPNKENYNGPMIDYILATCATVNDAIAFFEKYNTAGLRQARFPISDKTGASVVVEWAEGKVQFVKPDTWYQISTNFVITNVKDGKYPCSRYNIADTLFQGTTELSVDLIRAILSATHQENNYPTLYSNIFDLKNGIGYVYNFHNFEEVWVFNLADELKKGEKTIELPKQFSITTHMAKVFKNTRQIVASEVLLKIITKRGIEKAIERFHKMKKQFSKEYVYDFSEREMNSFGYQLLSSNSIKEAIAIFKLNVEEHPESWNCYDSLAEAYKKNGDKELSIKNYNKSLELNPENENGKKMVKKLEK